MRKASKCVRRPIRGAPDFRGPLLLLGILVVPAPSARAEDGGQPPKKTAPRRDGRLSGHILDGSGFVLPRGVGQVGLFEAGYGITDFLMISTIPIPWIAAPFLKGYSVNGSVKFGFSIADQVFLSAQFTPTFLHVKDKNTTESGTEENVVQGFLMPMTGAVTYTPLRNWFFSAAVRYILVRGSGGQSEQNQEVQGAAIANQITSLAQAHWQLSKRYAIYFRGNVKLWQRDLEVNGNASLDQSTDYELEATTETNNRKLWSVIAGVQFTWNDMIHLRLGLGYGDYFVPGLGIPVDTKSVIPDLDFYVRF